MPCSGYDWTPLLSNIKFCESSHCYMWIQNGVTVRKLLNWVLTSVTLTFDLWPWPFPWTSLLLLSRGSLRALATLTLGSSKINQHCWRFHGSGVIAAPQIIGLISFCTGMHHEYFLRSSMWFRVPHLCSKIPKINNWSMDRGVHSVCLVKTAPLRKGLNRNGPR